jgi:hypothetical protein
MKSILAAALPLLIVSTAAAADLEPVIVVYSGGTPELGELLASLIESDDRLDARVLIARSPGEVVLAAVTPATQCIVIYAEHKDYVSELDPALVPYFEEGGGLVGIMEPCYEPSAPGLATRVFPVFGNSSDRELSMKERRTRTYILEEASEIASGLPETFQILSIGTYLSADDEGKHVRVPGDYVVVYRDNATGCPLVIAHESHAGGRSVAFPGIMLAKVPRLDVYYGNLVLEEEFVKVFTNSVAWAAGNARIKRVEEGLAEAMVEQEDRIRQLLDEAEKTRRSKATGRMVGILLLWAGGLVSIGVVLKKLVLVPG